MKVYLFLAFIISTIFSEKLAENDNINDEELSDDIVILHTNDVHCGVNDSIGYDGLMLYKKEMQKKHKYVLTVDVGDHVQGDLLGLLSKGIDIIDIMNKVGYDISILGNHEFDFGVEQLEVCRQRLNCGYICSNYCYRKNKTSVYDPYVIKEFGNIKIGFISTLTPQTLTKTYVHTIKDKNGSLVYDFLSGHNFQDLYTAVQSHIDDMRNQGVDYVILLNHMGDDGNPNNKYTSVELLSHLRNISAVLDGHTHKVYTNKTKDKDGKEIIIAQTGTKLKNIGKLTIKTNGTIISEMISKVPKPENTTGAINVTRNGEERWVDKEMYDFLIEKAESHGSELNEVVGTSDFDIIINTDPGKDHHMHTVRIQEDPLGNLISDSVRKAGKADIGIITGGSIRDDLFKGNITSLNILKIIPYTSEVIVKKMLGQDILDAFEMGMAFLPKHSPKFMQISGATFKVNQNIDSPVQFDGDEIFVKVEGQRRVYDVKIQDKEVDPKKYYTLAIDQYTGNGGDGYSMIGNSETINSTQIMNNKALSDFIKIDLNGKLTNYYQKAQGRIVIATPSNENKGSKIWLYIVIPIASIIVLGILIAIIIVIKKRKANSISNSEIESMQNLM